MTGTSGALAPDFRLDDTQQALADSVAGFCRERAERFQTAPIADLWQELAELGIPALATPASGTGALEAAAVFESLGAGGCPGPLAETLVATQLLPDDLRSAVSAGERIASIAQGELVPFAGHAEFVIALDASNDSFLCHFENEPEAFRMHGGEPWGRGPLTRDAALGPADAALALADIGVASYLSGAGLALVAATADYAGKRKQFGRSIGEFQAVAHPLADLYLRLESARDLSRAAAWHWDQTGPAGGWRARSAAARSAASRAALDAAAAAHQIHGAVAYSQESAVPAATGRLRTWALLRPGADSAEDALLLGSAGWSVQRK